jgi:hypothetical protein
MIKLPTVQRAEITDGFKEAFRQLYKDLFRKFEREIETAPSYARDRLEKSKKIHMVRINRTLSDGAAFDMAMTKLRTLEYTKFDIHDHNGTPYLWCITKPAIAKYEHGHETVMPPGWRYQSEAWKRMHNERYLAPFTIDLGPYWIFIPIADVLSAGMNRVHFVPERDQYTEHRHLHHHTDGGPSVNPLDAHPYTCWGTFPNIVSSCMQDGDIIELLRTLQIFTVRLNPASPLQHLDQMSFWKVITK